MKTTKTTTATKTAALLTLLGLPALLAVGPEVAAGQAVPRLVDVAWLRDAVDDPDLVILQVGPEELYQREHVPGARHVSTAMLTAAMPPGEDHSRHLVLELPPWEDLRGRLEGLGVSDGSRIVVVPAATWITPSTRVTWVLDWAGLGDRTGLLDGGLEAWKAAGGDVTARVPLPATGSLRGEPDPSRRVDADQVRAHGDDGSVALVDARAGAFYDGVRDDGGVTGHIPGAGSVPWLEVVEELEGENRWRFRSPEELVARLRRAGVEPGDRVVAYCHIGQFGTAVYFAAGLAGHESALYDGSMNDWRLRGLSTETSAAPAGGR